MNCLSHMFFVLHSWPISVIYLLWKTPRLKKSMYINVMCVCTPLKVTYNIFLTSIGTYCNVFAWSLATSCKTILVQSYILFSIVHDLLYFINDWNRSYELWSVPLHRIGCNFQKYYLQGYSQRYKIVGRAKARGQNLVLRKIQGIWRLFFS